MAITRRDVQELRAKIAEDRKKLEEQEAALRVLEAMVAEAEAKGQWQQINIDELQVPDSTGKKSFNDVVEEVVRRLNHQEFTVSHIMAVLERENKVPNGKSPKARIAMALAMLEEKNIVERTFRGKGSEPHRFKVRRVRLVENTA